MADAPGGVQDVLLDEQGINGGRWEVQLSTSRGGAPSDGLDNQLPGELETDVGWASLAKLAMPLTTTCLFAPSEGPQGYSGSP